MKVKMSAGAVAFVVTAAAVSGNVLVYTGEGTASQGYSKFATATGKTVVYQTVLPADLSGYECIVLPPNNGGYSSDTLNALGVYVNAGGRIIAEAEHNGTPFGIAAVEAKNSLAMALGADLSVVGAYIDIGSFSTTTNIDPSPFTVGVGSITYTGVSEVQVMAGSDAQSLVRTVGGTTFIGVDQIGEGVFALLGDMNVLSDASNGYTSADNGILAANLCDGASFDTGDDDAIEIAIDIKFCSDPNAFNCKKKGVLPVTLFGSASLNVADIDISTLQLCTEDLSVCTNAPVASSVADRGDPTSDLGAAQCAMLEVDGGLFEEQDYLRPDGYDDLDVAFDANEVQEMLGSFCTMERNAVSGTLVIKGATYEGTPISSVPVGNTGIDQLVKKQ